MAQRALALFFKAVTSLKLLLLYISKIMPEVTHCSSVRFDFKSQVLRLLFLTPSCYKIPYRKKQQNHFHYDFTLLNSKGLEKANPCSFRVWWVWSYVVTALYTWSLRHYWFVYPNHLLPNTFRPFSEPLIKKVELHTVNSIKNSVKLMATGLTG